MPLRFVSKNIHAWLDYPVALALMALPFALNLGQSHPMAFWLSVVTGIAAFLLTVLTDHQFGILRIVPYPVHLAVDLMVGITFLAAPIVLGFAGIDAAFYWINGAAVVTVIALHRPEQQASYA